MNLTTLCYLKDQGKTLMLHRTKKKNDASRGKWNGLGGKMFPGESPEECVIREVKEESGFTIQGPKLRGFLTYPAFSKGQDEYAFLFTATKFEGTQINCDEGDLKWIDDSEISKLNLWEGDQYFFNWLEEKSLFSAKMIYHNGKLKSHEVFFYG
jgi:8-oxo-dGTP diphosphatase